VPVDVNTLGFVEANRRYARGRRIELLRDGAFGRQQQREGKRASRGHVGADCMRTIDLRG
jgi:hypothetical protein